MGSFTDMIASIAGFGTKKKKKEETDDGGQPDAVSLPRAMKDVAENKKKKLKALEEAGK